MSVETLSSEEVRAALNAVERAHQKVSEEVPGSRSEEDDPQHWQDILEANAAAVLAELDHVALDEGYVVRYRFFERIKSEIRVRPFVARRTTDVELVRAALGWHPPPDSGSAAENLRTNRDAGLLYEHFTFTDSALGVLHYWLAMQEIWASAGWVHTRIVADQNHFAELVAGDDWQIEQSVESYQPVVMRGEQGAHLALLLYSPLERHSIGLQQIEIRPDKSIVFAAPIAVATGPRGYVG